MIDVTFLCHWISFQSLGNCGWVKFDEQLNIYPYLAPSLAPISPLSLVISQLKAGWSSQLIGPQPSVLPQETLYFFANAAILLTRSSIQLSSSPRYLCQFSVSFRSVSYRFW